METANVWHVSSFNLDFHLPLLSDKELKGFALTLERIVRYVSNKVQGESKRIIRGNGTGKCAVKALAFHPRRRTSLSLSMVA